MRYLLLAGLVAVPLSFCAGQAPAQTDKKPDAAQVEFFEKNVRPILAENCYKCHGPEKQKAKLRLDSRAAMLQGGDSGAVIVPGNPDGSLLIQAAKHTEELRMPPPPETKLSGEQLRSLTAWIKMGAPWPNDAAVRPVTATPGKITPKDREFWAFQPVKKQAVPKVKNGQWVKSPIDAFVLATLEQKGLSPAPPADKRGLIRRVYFDLIGLPPTPEEVDAFLADNSVDAFAKVVDRLLASPHYGERWARHWLDVARYGEDQAHTFEARKYPDGFRYRDWVVKAFNADMPFNRFVTYQIAGDLLEDGPRTDRLAATGFFALGPIYYGNATADELDDRIDTLTRGFLGLTVACARCHDHKFDPVPTRDYYSLAGIFASTGYKEFVLTPEGAIDDKAVQESTDKVKGDAKKAPRKPVIHALTEGKKIANMKVNIRGNPKNLGETAPRQFLTILSSDKPKPFTKGSGRLELAQAIASKDNPLTARVMVNRLWQHHFGRGIVSTPSNFGSLGERPSHPELLDYLASRFVASGWSIKQMHREILLSSAYQMSSRHDADSMKVDPDNRYLWRMSRRKLDVEAWRDAMLAIAGNLDRKMGGPSLNLSDNKNQRRTLYAAISRNNLDPVLRLFDFPDPNLTGDQRTETIVPLQQLFVLNSDFMVQQAKALAARLTVTASESDTQRIRRAYLLVYGRPASERDIQLGTAFLNAQPGGNGAQGKMLTPWQRYAQVLLSANELAFVD